MAELAVDGTTVVREGGGSGARSRRRLGLGSGSSGSRAIDLFLLLDCHRVLQLVYITMMENKIDNLRAKPLTKPAQWASYGHKSARS